MRYGKHKSRKTRKRSIRHKSGWQKHIGPRAPKPHVPIGDPFGFGAVVARWAAKLRRGDK